MTEINNKEYGMNPIAGIKELAKDIEVLFDDKNFPGADPGWLDAARHFYGQALATKKYGFAIARGAGIVNESKGSFHKGHKRKVTQNDFNNNSAGRNFYYDNESIPFFKIIEDFIANPNSLTEVKKDSLMNKMLEKAEYATAGNIKDHTKKSNRYTIKRLTEFLKDAY